MTATTHNEEATESNNEATKEGNTMKVINGNQAIIKAIKTPGKVHVFSVLGEFAIAKTDAITTVQATEEGTLYLLVDVDGYKRLEQN